jgi:hypothetical protein
MGAFIIAIEKNRLESLSPVLPGAIKFLGEGGGKLLKHS